MANNITWYNEIFKNGMRRPSGRSEITESNWLDWERLRVLKDGNLVPFMRKGHIGAPSEVDLEVLRNEVTKGNIFLYRIGEAYPYHLTEDGWHSVDPDSKDEKEPELQLPEEPKKPEPFPYERKLEERLKANGLPAADDLVKSAKSTKEKLLFEQIVFDLTEERKRYEQTAQQTYEAERKKYEAERARLTQEHEAKHKAWEKRVAAFDKLSPEAKNAVRAGVDQRKIEIGKNREVQRDLTAWYYNEFRVKMVRPRAKATGTMKRDEEYERLAATEGIDWSRMRIWDGKEFIGVLPADHVGPPTTEALKHLLDAAQTGNLFMYQAADTYPSKWTGNYWRTMDKSWIDKLKPQPPEELPDKPKMEVEKPDQNALMRGISNRKVAVYRFFSRVGLKIYKSEWQKYHDAKTAFEERTKIYENALKKYEAEMEAYNQKMQIPQEEYHKKMRVYESMLESYEALTPEQKNAMEKDVQRRAEEIKQNKEVERKKANDLTVEQSNAQAKMANAENRMGLLNAKPNEMQFVGGEGALEQNAYEMIAPHSYNLPSGSKITLKDAAAIHLVLAGSTQAVVNLGLAPMSAQRYSQMMDGVLHGNPTAEELEYITAAYDAAKEYIGAYNGGDPKPLAGAMGEGLRNLLTVSRSMLTMSPEMAGLAMVAERIFTVLDKDQALMNNCTLSPEELSYARGLVQVGVTYHKNLEAQIKLTEQATGATKHTKEELVEYTVDLVINQTIENHLKHEPEPNKENLVTQLGNLEGNALNVIKETYKNDPEIQAVSTDPKNLMNTDMKERAKTVSQVIVDGKLSKPKEHEEVQNTVKEKVKEQLTQLDPVVKAKKTEMQLEHERNLGLAVDLLVQQDPALAGIAPEDERVQKKFHELSVAQQSVAQRTGNDTLALNDPLVLQEAADRAKIQELIDRERTENQFDKLDLSAGNVDKRMDSMRKVWQKLAKQDPNLSLTDQKVIDEERRIRTVKNEKQVKMVQEGTQAADVRQRETGLEGLNRNAWRQEIVKNRVKQLKAARKSLGEEFKDLPLNDMRVIQQDYKLRNIDPLKTNETIVDVANLTAEQKVDYQERMQTIDHLRSIKTQFIFRNSRGEPAVEKAMEELRAAREKYEATVLGAKKDLALNDPRIGAIRVLDLAGGGESQRKWKDWELEEFGKKIQGNNPATVESMAKAQLQKMGGEIRKNVQDPTQETQLRQPSLQGKL